HLRDGLLLDVLLGLTGLNDCRPRHHRHRGVDQCPDPLPDADTGEQRHRCEHQLSFNGVRLGTLDGDESSDVHSGAGRESEVGNLETEDRENQYEAGDHTGSTAWPRPRYGLSEETQVPPSMPEPSEPYGPNELQSAKPSVARLLAIII